MSNVTTLTTHVLQQVQGILKIANPFSNPFTTFCPKCEHKFEGFGVLDEQTIIALDARRISLMCTSYI